MNRGSEGNGDSIVDRAGASMRPRFMNRGSANLRRTSRSSLRRFNEAPIHESGK